MWLNGKGAGLSGKDCFTKLAKYEDTGLEPEEIADAQKAMRAALGLACELQAYKNLGSFDHIRELIQAERDGRLVVLPAKTVYELIWVPGPGCTDVCPVIIDGDSQCDMCDYGELIVREVECRQDHIDCIGKSVFLTRAEAEAALKGGYENA